MITARDDRAARRASPSRTQLRQQALRRHRRAQAAPPADRATRPVDSPLTGRWPGRGTAANIAPVSHRISPLTVLALVATLAGCGTSSRTSQTTTTPPPSAPTAPFNASAPVIIRVTAHGCVPPDVILAPGQPAEWINTDHSPRSVSATRGARFDSGKLAPGARYRYTPRQAGAQIAYRCGSRPRDRAILVIGRE